MNTTKIYLINTKASKALNSFTEANKQYSFEAVDRAKATMQNVMFAGYFFDEETKSAIARRIKFQSMRPGTAYRCMYLDLRSGKVITLNSGEALSAYTIQRKTEYANYAFDKLAKDIQAETAEWIALANHLTHGAIDELTWNTQRQNCLDKMNLYLTDRDFDAYNAGHLEPRMKKNVHTFTEDYKFFDLSFSKGDVTQHEEERETEQYVITDLETLKNFCHVLTCSRYGISFDDSKGNGGRVTREASQGIINYTEIAELINQLPADERQDIIEGLQDGTYTVEDIYQMYFAPADEVDSVSYREF